MGNACLLNSDKDPSMRTQQDSQKDHQVDDDSATKEENVLSGSNQDESIQHHCYQDGNEPKQVAMQKGENQSHPDKNGH